jgi:hypothetical protein
MTNILQTLEGQQLVEYCRAMPKTTLASPRVQLIWLQATGIAPEVTPRFLRRLRSHPNKLLRLPNRNLDDNNKPITKRPKCMLSDLEKAFRLLGCVRRGGELEI